MATRVQVFQKKIQQAKASGQNVSKYEGLLRQQPPGQINMPSAPLINTPSTTTQVAQPEAASSSGLTQNPELNAMIMRAMRPKGIVGKAGDAFTILGGGQPRDMGDDYSKLYAQEAIKKQFEEPSYVVSYDKEGNPVFTKAPGNIKNAPFYASPAGGQYYQARTGQAEAQGTQAKTETEMINTVLPQIRQSMSGQGGDITPGTTVQAGPFNVPLNPKLTESEQGVIGGVQAMEPKIAEIEQSLNSGILETPNLGDVGRTINQLRADRQSALFTATNPKLQQLQSELNTLKKTIPFTEGGKQLTETEKSMVLALLNISGKNNGQIMLDINRAMQILRAKEQLALGGRNVALEGTSNVRTGGNDLDAINAELEQINTQLGQ